MYWRLRWHQLVQRDCDDDTGDLNDHTYRNWHLLVFKRRHLVRTIVTIYWFEWPYIYGIYMWYMAFVFGVSGRYLVRTIVTIRVRLRDCRAVRRLVLFLCLRPWVQNMWFCLYWRGHQKKLAEMLIFLSETACHAMSALKYTNPNIRCSRNKRFTRGIFNYAGSSTTCTRNPCQWQAGSLGTQSFETSVASRLESLFKM